MCLRKHTHTHTTAFITLICRTLGVREERIMLSFNENKTCAHNQRRGKKKEVALQTMTAPLNHVISKFARPAV